MKYLGSFLFFILLIISCKQEQEPGANSLEKKAAPKTSGSPHLASDFSRVVDQVKELKQVIAGSKEEELQEDTTKNPGLKRRQQKANTQIAQLLKANVDKNQGSSESIIHYRHLLEWLPEKLGRFVGEEGAGQVNYFGALAISIAQKNYRTTRPTGEILIKITDSAINQMAALAFKTAVNFKGQGDNSQITQVTFNGFKGLLLQNSQDSTQKTINILVADRFFIQISSLNISTRELIKLCHTLELKKMAALVFTHHKK